MNFLETLDEILGVLTEPVVDFFDNRKARRKIRLSLQQRRLVKSLLQVGDVILESDDSLPFWKYAALLCTGQAWTHAAIYIGNGKIVDAGKRSRVSILPVDALLRSANVMVLRPAFKTPSDAEKAVELAKQYVGCTYNRGLRQRSSRSGIYCTQLIAECLRGLDHPIVLPPRHVLGRFLVTPDCMIKSPQFSTVYKAPSQTRKTHGTVYDTTGAARTC